MTDDDPDVTGETAAKRIGRLLGEEEVRLNP